MTPPARGNSTFIFAGREANCCSRVAGFWGEGETEATLIPESYALLSDQPRQTVTAQPQDQDYPLQAANALPGKLKTHAAQQVVAAMRDDRRPVPNLFRDVIETALKLAEEI